MNGLDLLNEVADRLGWPQIKTLDISPRSKETRKLLRILNRVLQTITGTQDWPLLRKTGTITLVPAETSDMTSGSEQYVTATQDSTTVTVANMSFDQTYVGRAFQVDGKNTVYQIDEIVAPTQVKLHRAWVGDSITATNELGFKIGVDQYTMPTDFDRPLTDMESFFAPYGILPIGPDEFAEIRRQERGITVGEPRRYTLYGMNDAQTSILLHLHPYPETQRLLNYPYQMIHPEINSDNDKVLFQGKHVTIVVEMVLELAQRDYEDDAKAQKTLLDMLRVYNQQLANPGVTDSRMRIRKTGRIRRSMQAGFGLGGHSIDWGTWFDKSDNYRLGS